MHNDQNRQQNIIVGDLDKHVLPPMHLCIASSLRLPTFLYVYLRFFFVLSKLKKISHGYNYFVI